MLYAVMPSTSTAPFTTGKVFFGKIAVLVRELREYIDSPPHPEMKIHSVAQAVVQWHHPGSLQPPPPGSSSYPASGSPVAGSTEMRFHHIGHAGLKPVISSDPPTSASQSAGITDMTLYIRPSILIPFRIPCISRLVNVREDNYQHVIFERVSCSVTQAGVRWSHLSTLQPLLLRFKLFFCPSLLSNCDYRSTTKPEK
ncbi:UPF0764 protein C16orf89, partial [Plecturocebus cupreus]